MGKWTKPWRGAETRLLHEWLANRYPDRRVVTNVRVGAVPAELQDESLSEAQLSALGGWRLWADAVVWDPPQIIIVEAMVIPRLGKISQLAGYLKLWPQTPEYADYRDWPAQGILLMAVDSPVVRAVARDAGLLSVVYTPPWVAQWLLTQSPGHRSPSLAGPV
jgi:hypothetical protein